MFGKTQTNTFGSTSTNSSGLSFGNSTNTFGNTTNTFGNTTNKPSTGLFGTKPSSNNLFGSTTQSSTTQQFGANKPTSNLFGNTNTRGNTFQSLQQPNTFQSFQVQNKLSTTTASSIANDIERRIIQIQETYNPNHPSCRFNFMFYNKVKPNIALQYQAPINVNKRLWEQAKRNNPDPNTLVPVQITGFNDLKKRLVQHQKASNNYNDIIKSLSNILETMQTEHHTVTITKIKNARKNTLELSHRLLKLMNKLSSLRGGTLPLESTEIDYRRRLDNIKRRLQKPGYFQSKVNELTSIVNNTNNNNNHDVDLMKTIDENSIRKIYEFLEHQSKGLKHIDHVVRKDLNDMQIIKKIN